MKKLTELEPSFVKYTGEDSFLEDDTLTIETAQGILFSDPLCDGQILCWFKDRGVPDNVTPGPGRWAVSGTDFNNLSLIPSVDLSCGDKYPNRWHGWVTNGNVN